MMARTAASTSAAASRLVARKARKRWAKSGARRRGGSACPCPAGAPVRNHRSMARECERPSTLSGVGWAIVPALDRTRLDGAPGRPEIGKLGLQALDLEPQRRRPRTSASRRRPGASVSANSTASRLSTASLPAGVDMLALAAVSTRSNRSAERQRRTVRASMPSAASQSKRLRPTTRRFSCGRQMDVGDLDHGILQMGGDDLEIVPVERDELQRLHRYRLLGWPLVGHPPLCVASS